MTDKIVSENIYKLIKDKLNRIPNETELRLFSAQWSEHCGYLHSKEVLKREFGNVMEENAGYVKIGEESIVFKVESHNHPSAVEPYQGAATGIGGIVRDVIAMGARPIALLDSLRFGDLNDSKSKNIFEGVVSGISDYGNSIGVPTIAGETYFDESFSKNPIVNVMCVGKAKKVSSSITKKPRALLVYVGSKTGRDGIHGASFASKKLGEEDNRPSVQVGDPFSEKNLIEATLEILSLDGVDALQDMGAAGLLSSSSEMAEKSGKGCELYLNEVPLREEKMEAWEIMLSESQERMLFAVEPGTEDRIKEIARKYFLDFAVVGKLTDDEYFTIYYKNKMEAKLPLKILVDAPSLYRKVEMVKDKDMNYPKIILSPKEVLLNLLDDPNISDKSWIYNQYDYKVGTRTLLPPGTADASILWLKNSNKGVAVTIDGNHNYSSIDPFNAGKNIVYETARNIVSVGGKPLGITDNMNFGNPEKDKVMWEFEQSVKGIAEACRELNIKVTGGNVSFYNESISGEIFPCPVIGMVGEVENVKNIMTLDFKNPSDLVYLVGKVNIESSKIGGSYFLKRIFNFIGGELDKVDSKFELKLQSFILYLIKEKIVNSVHDISIGGLAIALLKSVLGGSKGFKMTTDLNMEELFGENQSRFIVSISPEMRAVFERQSELFEIPVMKIGEVMPTDYGFDIGDSNLNLVELKEKYFNNIKRKMELE
jgi:phosphoribosylformylglycinamidine synthase II